MEHLREYLSAKRVAASLFSSEVYDIEIGVLMARIVIVIMLIVYDKDSAFLLPSQEMDQMIPRY